MHGNQHNIQAVGLESLTEVECTAEDMKLKRLFQEVDEEPTMAFNRPHGKVDVMLGLSARNGKKKSVAEEAHSVALERSAK